MENLNFSQVLDLLKSGKRAARKGWNNPAIFVEVQTPDANSKMTKPYLYMVKSGSIATDGISTPAQVFPLDLSCESIFAEDWFVIETV